MRVDTKAVLIVTALAAILVCVALANMQYISRPRLVIEFDGKPASNVTLIFPYVNGRPAQLDAEGSISASPGSETLLLVPFPDGGGATVGFPEHGTKVVDFQGRITTTTIVQYFGLVTNQYESFSLTDEQFAEIESGLKTRDEIVEEIRRSQ